MKGSEVSRGGVAPDGLAEGDGRAHTVLGGGELHFMGIYFWICPYTMFLENTQEFSFVTYVDYSTINIIVHSLLSILNTLQ